jgi:hypothetical protein
VRAVAHVAVNVAKFGTLLDLPADRQLLTLQNPARATWFAGNDGSFFSLRFLPTTVAQYLRPRRHPLRAAPSDRPLRPAGAAVRVVSARVDDADLLAHRHRQSAGDRRGGRSRDPVAPADDPDVDPPRAHRGWSARSGADVRDRVHRQPYLVDMLPMLLVPAAAAFVLVDVGGRGRRVVVSAILALVAWGAWSNVALATWVQNLKEPGFTEWRYEVDGAVFGEPVARHRRLRPRRTGPAQTASSRSTSQGGACRSVYVAEDARWNALEHAEGFRRLTGELIAAPDGRRVVAR